MEQSAKYAYEVYKQQSFSRAAKILYISQPSLSMAISRLEKDLGFQIFDRTKVPIRLTIQGQIYMDAVEEMLESEQTMLRRLRALKQARDHLNIGGYSHTAFYLMADVCAAFQKAHPHVKVNLDIGAWDGREEMYEKLRKGELDAIFSYVNTAGLPDVPVHTERLVIAMHKDLPGAEALRPLSVSWDEVVSRSYAPDRQIEDMSIFADIPFLSHDHKAPTRAPMVSMLGEYTQSLCQIVNYRHSVLHMYMLSAGLGALLVPDIQIAKSRSETENLLFFVPKAVESYRKTYLIRSPLTLEDPLVNEFARIAKETCGKL